MQALKHGERLQHVQQWMLAIALGGSLLAIAKTFFPSDSLPKTPTFTFPTSVSIPGWQFLQSNEVAVQKRFSPALVSRLDEHTIAGRQYQYRRAGNAITIEMRYLMRGIVDVPSILQERTLTLNQPEWTPRDRASIGTYALYEQNRTPHISTCITPHGNTLVQDSEFRRYQTYPTVVIKRLLPWVLGQAPLRDTRCLWVDISIKHTVPAPVPTAASPLSTPELEEAWAEWVQSWQGRFPQP
ncbi:cyanoexosortase A system-associated protein [Myxacorys almedinensis]|uniref:Cyanoexosortase A system-associated protein n=1 Tax=Myxacorys almedinensis A TaxID=2690445 RepID=A0A8J7Z6L2_9CYAN|nr:cyanoexosortase A system-associated protein [Myxacorys almedinensis]NDJ19111.1 cyanoexosortase A system-associated protein [Myxacorys almedinensis A]